MIGKRGYKEPLGYQDVNAKIASKARMQFDLLLVEALIREQEDFE